MRSWQVQTARAHFSELVDAALAEGPQRVMRRGRGAVVIVSEAEWQRRALEESDGFGAFLLSFPADAETHLPKRRPARMRREPPLG
jgi:prevent-host-death family protein